MLDFYCVAHHHHPRSVRVPLCFPYLFPYWIKHMVKHSWETVSGSFSFSSYCHVSLYGLLLHLLLLQKRCEGNRHICQNGGYSGHKSSHNQNNNNTSGAFSNGSNFQNEVSVLWHENELMLDAEKDL